MNRIDSAIDEMMRLTDGQTKLAPEPQCAAWDDENVSEFGFFCGLSIALILSAMFWVPAGLLLWRLFR